MKILYYNVFTVAFLAGALAASHAQTTFTRVVLDNTGSEACAWGDFNNDGLLDLFGTGYGTASLLYLNNSNGGFTSVLQGDPVADVDYHVGSAWGDYDNDGHLDLLVAVGSFAPAARNNLLYHNNGDATFSLSADRSITTQLGFFGVCGWADYDNDGFLDFCVTTLGDASGSVGGTLLYHNDGNGRFTRITTGAVVNDPSRAWSVLWSDYDNDGLMDLLVINNFRDPTNFQHGVNLLYHNNGNGAFARVLTNIVGTDRWTSVALAGAWGDYDNDGLQDLFVTSGDGPDNRLYHNNGNGTFETIASGPMLPQPPGGEPRGCAWGDFDNDGYLDLFVANVGANNTLFHNNGDGTFTQILSGDPVNDGNSSIASWVDYDNDGFLDLFTSISPDSGGSQNVLYHNDGNTNAWLEVKCVGTVANRSAIGTKVRVRATIGGKTFSQLREINNGGFWSPMPLVAHFGLGDATNIEVVRIEWPSRTVQEFHNIAPRQIWTITEPPRWSASLANGTPQFTLKGGRGFQYQVESSTNLMAWLPMDRLTITNFNGTAELLDTNALGLSRRFYRAWQR